MQLVYFRLTEPSATGGTDILYEPEDQDSSCEKVSFRCGKDDVPMKSQQCCA